MRAIVILMLLGIVGCASYVKKEDLKAYVPIQGDIARACLNQCGRDQMVTAWGAVEGKLKCECSKIKTAKK